MSKLSRKEFKELLTEWKQNFVNERVTPDLIKHIIAPKQPFTVIQVNETKPKFREKLKEENISFGFVGNIIVHCEKEDKIKDFADLLDELENTKDKKKLLWKEAYRNALSDRESASVLVDDLLLQIQGNLNNHQQFGALMTKYLERMSKSNDQILRLAELIAKEEESSGTISPDDIFKEISE